jgi:inosose dehydratase
MHRRTFLSAAATLAVSSVPLRTAAAPASAPAPPVLATNTSPWGQFAKRDQLTFPLHTAESLAAVASSGLAGYEPAVRSPAEFDGLAARLAAAGLALRSFYVNSALHEPALAAASHAEVLALARAARPLGAKIIVTNPAPLRWGGPENKTDAQLRTQAAALDRLGADLRALGLTLAYHNHDIELRSGAREFHHMLSATDPAHVRFCLDVHWVYRGCGDSQVALFDVVDRYADRIVELHLRQSRDGIWTEVFTAEGDIDYPRLAAVLRARRVAPLLVLEQAPEKGTPRTLDAVAAHRQSATHAARIFAGFA